jgi:hypothetical protein
MWRRADADLIRVTAHEQQRPAALPPHRRPAAAAP